MNPQDAMLLFITASQDYLVIHFVYLQLSCTTSNFGSLTRGNPHSPYFNHILLSVPTRRISAIPRVYLDIQLRFTWPGYNPGVIVVGKEGKNLDLRSSRSLQSTLPDENDTIKKKIFKPFGVATSVTITIYEVYFDIYTAALWIRKKTRHKVDKGYGE